MHTTTSSSMLLAQVRTILYIHCPSQPLQLGCTQRLTVTSRATAKEQNHKSTYYEKVHLKPKQPKSYYVRITLRKHMVLAKSTPYMSKTHESKVPQSTSSSRQRTRSAPSTR